MKSSTVVTIIVVLLILVGLVYVTHHRKSSNIPSDDNSASTTDDTGLNEPVTVTYLCVDNKSITATFTPTDDNVELTLSDGRSLTVPHALSASGARYANADESFVFWNKGNTAFITEDSEETFSNCVEEGTTAAPEAATTTQ
jgi:membrane-bound inhibitor of C-type lysozyme